MDHGVSRVEIAFFYLAPVKQAGDSCVVVCVALFKLLQRLGPAQAAVVSLGQIQLLRDSQLPELTDLLV